MLLIVRPCPRPPRFHPLLLARRPRCGHGSHVGGGGSGQGGSRRSGGGAKYRPLSIFQSLLFPCFLHHDWSILYTNNFLVRECFYLLVISFFLWRLYKW